jgi:filamentous hemagglutinin family protein
MFSPAFCISTLAEIIADNTLMENSRITHQGGVEVIEGGTQLQGSNNLFHSFQEFSVSPGGTAYFNNSRIIENIFARVTGGSRSEIDGALRANGEANLFLLNPNGILFGPNASLNIGGSFLASTANSINFADGTQFSAVRPQASPLLTVSTPIGFQFGQNPARIVNRSIVTSIDSRTGELTTGLQVANNETLALIGGEVNIPGGIISTFGGRVEIGAIGTNASSAQVSLSPADDGFNLEYTNVQNFQDIRLSRGAFIDVSGAGSGNIQIQGQTIRLAGESSFFANSEGLASSGTTRINATQSVILEGGSQIATSTSGGRQAGDIVIEANDSVQLLGASSSGSPSVFSGIGSQVDQAAIGNGGNVTITTNRLILRNGGGIDSSTFGEGDAGSIRITASDSIELSGAEVFGGGVRDQILSGIFAQVGIGAIEEAGDAGTITIQTGELTLLGGAQISSAARTGGRGGNVNITADDSIRLSGRSPNATSTVGRSGIFVSAEQSATRNAGQLNITTRQLTVENGGEISANNFGPARGGTISIDTDQLTVREGGDIRATSFDEETGQAGNLQISANLINLDDGRLTAETRAGETANANITLQNVDALLIQNQGQLSARAFNNAPGGNVFIFAPQGFAIAAGQNNDIVADASRGRGGNITIEAQSILGLEERRSQPSNLTNDIDASSEFGAPGSVTIIEPDVDPNRGLVELPTDIVDASSLVAQGCAAVGGITADQLSEFVITGRGGLSANPTTPLSREATLSNWISLPSQSEGSTATPSATHSSTAVPLIEAQGWVMGSNGEVMLTAQAPAVTTTPSLSIATASTCTAANQ